MPVLLCGTHLFFTIRTGFVQKHTLRAVRFSVSGGFSALARTLAATLGTGNIVGISTAVALGGAGAVFWCWLTGIFGMATTYAECYLGLSFRKDTPYGPVSGPMTALESGLNCRPLAFLYCIFLLPAGLGMCCSTSSVLRQVFDSFLPSDSIFIYVFGILCALLIGLVINGGAGFITTVCTRLVPAMTVLYLGSCIAILIMNRAYLPASILLIFRSAFGLRAIGSGLIGGTLQLALRYGIARGLFTNEAGIGSAAIAASEDAFSDTAVLKPDCCRRMALISMSATFWDTVVMCAITGIVIVSSLLRIPSVLPLLLPGELITAAFSLIPGGVLLLNISLVAFAFATLIGWYYIAERVLLYLKSGFTKKHKTGSTSASAAVSRFRLTYMLCIFLGFVLSLELVFEISDLLNAFLILPNLLSLFLLQKLLR